MRRLILPALCGHLVPSSPTPAHIRAALIKQRALNDDETGVFVVAHARESTAPLASAVQQ